MLAAACVLIVPVAFALAQGGAEKPLDSPPKGVASALAQGSSATDASRVVARMRAGFRACYHRGLAASPALSGKISLNIVVGPEGQVLSVQASPSGNLPKSMVECVQSRAKAARFAPPDGGRAVIEVPVSFVKQ